MPRPPTTRRVVQVRFERETVERLAAVAKDEGWLWFRSEEIGETPSVSEAARRLVDEALAARATSASTPAPEGATVTVKPNGLKWIDGEAERVGVSRDEMVRTLLGEARAARMAVSSP